MEEPTFPHANRVQLPVRYLRDLDTLTRSLKFSNPHEILAHWELFIRRLLRAGESIAAEAFLDYLLGGMYAFYGEELVVSATRLKRARADRRLNEAEVARLERGHEALVSYQRQIALVLPSLRQLLLKTAAEIMGAHNS